MKTRLTFNIKLIRSIITQYRQSHNRPQNDRSIIDEALNLFAPKQAPKNTSNYKPSILSSVAYGPVSEQYQTKITREPQDVDAFKVRTDFSTGRLVNFLDVVSLPRDMLDLNNKILKSTDSEFRQIIGEIRDQEQLVYIFKFLYLQDKLNLSKLTTIVLNKNLRNLSLLPFDLKHPEDSMLNWPALDYTKLRVTLLRKFQTMHKPLHIVKNLEQSFDHDYLPSMRSKELPQFYERTIWKYYFEYVSHMNKHKDESYFIHELNDLYHSFTIWESSKLKSLPISTEILKVHKSMNRLQQLFFKICSQESVNRLINSQLQKNKYSDLLNVLKKISINYKFYSFGELEDTSIETRATYYMVIDSLEKLLVHKIVPFAKGEDVSELVSELNEIKKIITKFEASDDIHENNWDDKLVLLSSFLK